MPENNPPDNLPVGEAEFLKREEVKTMARDIASLREMEAKTEKERIVGLKPKEITPPPQPPSPPSVPSVPPLPPVPLVESKPVLSSPYKKIIVRGIIILLSLFLLGFGFWLWQGKKPSEEKITPPIQEVLPLEEPEEIIQAPIIQDRLVTRGFRNITVTRSIDTIIIYSVVKETQDRGTAFHYLIARSNGTIYRLVADNNIAYHAGTGIMPDGTRKNTINSFSIGIGLVYGKNDSPNELQYQSLSNLVKYLRQQYNIPLENVLRKQDISPDKGANPSNFNWEKFNQLITGKGTPTPLVAENITPAPALAPVPVAQKCTDGTIYNQCSTNKPKYCENGNLVDKSSSCGCPTNFKLQNGECTPLTNTNETIVFREKNPGEILISPTASYEWWSINVEKFKEQFYQNYGDFYDFILLFPTKSLQAHYSITVNYDVKGLGVGYKPDSNLKQLKSITELDFYTIWSAFSESTIRQELLRTIAHEMGHHWCCYIGGFGINLPLHWTYNIDLFNGNPAYLDIMGYFQWIRKDSQEICVENIPSITKRFSDLTLYLMGLLPKEQVRPIYVHDFEKKPGDSYFNTWGPSCDSSYKFLGTRTVTIDDIIKANGSRIPSYENSQKDFRVAFVILSEKNEDVPQGFIDYVKLYKQALPAAWEEATDGKSHITY